MPWDFFFDHVSSYLYFRSLKYRCVRKLLCTLSRGVPYAVGTLCRGTTVLMSNPWEMTLSSLFCYKFCGRKIGCQCWDVCCKQWSTLKLLSFLQSHFSNDKGEVCWRGRLPDLSKTFAFVWKKDQRDCISNGDTKCSWLMLTWSFVRGGICHW